jgi:hypothetical protein
MLVIGNAGCRDRVVELEVTGIRLEAVQFKQYKRQQIMSKKVVGITGV